MTKVFIKKITLDNNVDFEFSSYKKDKISRCTNKKRINELIQGEKLLVQALSDLGLKCEIPLDIVTNEYGKPYLRDNKFFFNISHSKNYIACAISLFEVGLDIEQIDDRYENIIQKLLTTEELKNNETNIEYLIKIWTVKEAYTKLIGTGINMNLKEINTSSNGIENDFNIFLIEGAKIANVITDGLSISVASKNIENEVYIKMLN